MGFFLFFFFLFCNCCHSLNAPRLVAHFIICIVKLNQSEMQTNHKDQFYTANCLSGFSPKWISLELIFSLTLIKKEFVINHMQPPIYNLHSLWTVSKLTQN